MQAEFPQLKDVHSLIEEADQLEDRHSYHSAREIYKEAVSILLPLIESKHYIEMLIYMYIFFIVIAFIYMYM